VEDNKKRYPAIKESPFKRDATDKAAVTKLTALSKSFKNSGTLINGTLLDMKGDSRLFSHGKS
jgi:hypothetical protein